MLTIGELSRISQVTVKSIRYYQELGILLPEKVDPTTNYRFFTMDSYNRLQSILTLKDLGFTLKEISEILESCSNEYDLNQFIIEKIKDVREKVKKLKDIEFRLKKFSSQINQNSPEIIDSVLEFNLDIPIYTSVKVNGSYSDIGFSFSSLYKNLGRYIKGAPFAIYYDIEYKDENPNFYAGVELSKKVKVSKYKIESISEKKAIKLLYKGPYGGQGKIYAKLFEYCRSNGYQVDLPIIERYIKGPGFIFKGNPKNYLTECILLIK